MPTHIKEHLTPTSRRASAARVIPILYRHTNALMDFQSPSISARGADFASVTGYSLACAPIAAKADAPGRARAQDGTTTGEQPSDQADTHNHPPALGRSVTCPCRSTRPPASPRCRGLRFRWSSNAHPTPNHTRVQTSIRALSPLEYARTLPQSPGAQNLLLNGTTCRMPHRHHAYTTGMLRASNAQRGSR